jgi:hypothetical protein
LSSIDFFVLKKWVYHYLRKHQVFIKISGGGGSGGKPHEGYDVQGVGSAIEDNRSQDSLVLRIVSRIE